MIKVNNIVTTMTKLNDILTIFMYSLNKSIKEKDFVEEVTFLNEPFTLALFVFYSFFPISMFKVSFKNWHSV